MRKMFLCLLLLLINISVWGQTAASYSVRVEISSTTLTDRNWVSEISKWMSGMNEIAVIYNTGVIAYEINRLNSLEQQLLQKANVALSKETIQRGETWSVGLEQRPMENAPRGTMNYIFYFHRDSNGELYYLLFRLEKFS